MDSLYNLYIDNIFYVQFLVVQEVNERVLFLKDMEVLGQAHKYYPIIRQEIAAKVREMERIDKERCRELEKSVDFHTT